MSEARLLRKLDEVVFRIRRKRAIKASLACWLLFVLAIFVMMVQQLPRIEMLSVFAAGIFCSWMVSLFAGRSRSTDRKFAACQLEKTFPELDTMLLAALNQKPVAGRWEFGYLHTELISKLLEHSRQQDWGTAARGLTTARFARMGALLTCLLLLWNSPATHPARVAAHRSEDDPAATTQLPIEIFVEPGDTEVEQGTSLLVLARFPQALPSQVTLVATDQHAGEVRIPLQKSLDDPIFGGRIPEVNSNLTYHVEFDTQSSDDYSVTTFTYPKLLQANAKINFPTYTGLEAESVRDVRRLSVVEGADIDFDFEFNKEVQSAAFVDREGRRIELQPTAIKETQRKLTWSASSPKTQKFQLELVDQEGRRNREISEFVVQVIPNQPPKLKVDFPARDVRVSQLEELSLQAGASDDYGLVAYGLVYETPDGKQAALELGEKAGPDEQKTIDHLLPLETLNVTADQLISYYFYADDIGPDGQQRRVFSDIFFSEVRPFEEIFREAQASQSQQQQQQQQGTQSGELVEVQRQIVTAIWNLIRSESSAKPSASFLAETETLFESQELAISMGQDLMAKLKDEQMQQALNEAIEAMTSASGFLAHAISQQKVAALRDARSKAQEAYQSLLKLNSREKQVQQSQQSQSQSQSSKPQERNRQLNALELKNDRDRYETERQAQQQQQQEQQRETLQVLNRLRELARRQEDLNEKIRDLENKLRDAEQPEDKAELERELKRLQEEQEELLRNLDELKERMNQEQNRQRMAEARQQVEQTRERVLQASEALKQNQTSRALTEGTRAQRELEQLKEEFKNKSASQFEEQVRELRDDVRKLAENQEELTKAMHADESSAAENERKSLRPQEGQQDREQIAKALENQKEQLSEVLNQTRQLVQDSENTEPLLSNKLYETMRDLRKFEPEEALQGAAQLQRYGINSEARKAEEQARRGIERLEEGVEEAARGILGDEQQALAAASDNLEELTRSIENELRENLPGTDRRQTDHPEGSSPASPNQGNLPEEQQSGQETSPSQQGEPSPRETSSAKPGTANSQQAMPEAQSSSPGAGNSQADASEKPSQTPESSQKANPGRQQQNNPSAQSPRSQQSAPQPGQQSGSPSAAGGRPQSASNLGQQLGNLFQEQSSPNGGGTAGPQRPLTGDEYREWSDRMRDLEEMVTTPELRSQVATIRDRARQMRIDLKRHSKAPDWELVRTSIYGPMVELQQLIAEELARRAPDDQLVPIDRDPIPEKYTDLLQKYYEELARQQRNLQQSP